MLKKIFRYSIFIILLSTSVIKAQNIEYAKSIINDLSSPEFHGRGYVNNGLAIAADYIAGEYRKNELKPLFKDYLQHFTIPVNTFPGKVNLKVNNISLQPVSEFIVDPASPGLSGTFPAILINKSVLMQQKELNKQLKKANGKFLIVENYNYSELNLHSKKANNDIIKILKYDPRLNIAGVIEITDEKFSWNISGFAATKPSFMVASSILDVKKIETVTIDIENRFFKEFPVANIAGFVKGKLQPDSFIVFTAHYDHLGQMGQDIYFPGANDNASGVALILTLASHFNNTIPDYSIIFIAFAGEETGLLGSKHFVENSPVDLKKIKFLVNLDLVGNGEEGITVVNGTVFPEKFNTLSEINQSGNYFETIKPRGEACNSDHCYFYQKGVPCFFIYTMGGIHAYHDLNDTICSLTLSKFSDLSDLLIDFVDSF